MDNWLIFWGIWGEAELFLGIWGAKANTFRETRTLFAGRRGDQCIIFRDQGSTDLPWGPHRCGYCLDLINRLFLSLFAQVELSHFHEQSKWIQVILC